MTGTLRPEDGETAPDALCRVCETPIFAPRRHQARVPAYCSPECRKVAAQHYRDAHKAQRAAYDHARYVARKGGTAKE